MVLLEGRHRGGYRTLQKGEFRPAIQKAGGGGGGGGVLSILGPIRKVGGGGLSALGLIRKAGGGGGCCPCQAQYDVHFRSDTNSGGGGGRCLLYDLRFCARA